MACWQDEALPMLRVLINDMDLTDLTYSDDRLEEVLVVAASYVQQEISFDNTYTISIAGVTITPDPVGQSDTEFVNFMVLKAACLTDWGTFRQKALISGLRARCGPAVLETLKHTQGFQTLLELGPCASYEELKDDYQFGNTNVVRAVLSPFRGNNFDPASLATTRTNRRI